MSITIDSIQYDNYIEQEPDIKKGKLYDRKMFLLYLSRRL